MSTQILRFRKTIDDAALHFFGREGYDKIHQKQVTWADSIWPLLAVLADLSSTLGPVASGGFMVSLMALLLFATMVLVRSRYCQLCAIPCAISFVLTLSFGIVLGLQTLTASDDLGVIRSSVVRIEAKIDEIRSAQKKAELAELERREREEKARVEADRKHQEQLALQNQQLEETKKLRLEIAREKGIDPKFLIPLFEAARQDAHIKPDQFETTIRTAIDALITRSRDPVQPSNDGADIDAAIRAARQKLAVLDTEGAIASLLKREREEAEMVQARNRGRASLKREEAAIYKSTFRHEEAIASLNEATMLDPEDIITLIDLGDIY